MHYINKRPAKIGDWVIGPTHNSNGAIRVGLVKELMPQQGPCNVKLHIWPSRYNPGDDGCAGETILPWDSQGSEDYADAKTLVHVIDGWKTVKTIEEDIRIQMGDDSPWSPRMGMAV